MERHSIATRRTNIFHTGKMDMSIHHVRGAGMRIQELLALESRHIEEDGSVIHVRQAANFVKGSVYVDVSKPCDSYRDIPVSTHTSLV